MMVMIQLLFAAQALAAPLDFSDALKRADSNEAALALGVKTALVRSQDDALRASMASCVDLAPGKLPAFTIILKLDPAGQALQSWRNNDVPMVRCVERELRNGAYKTDGKDDFFMSFVVTFKP